MSYSAADECLCYNGGGLGVVAGARRTDRHLRSVVAMVVRSVM